ncbi:hypothetical protein BG005_003799 [Podila minutissima]|nr:hypothetical protein BG005_003799 [Podila minutissima]
MKELSLHPRICRCTFALVLVALTCLSSALAVDPSTDGNAIQANQPSPNQAKVPPVQSSRAKASLPAKENKVHKARDPIPGYTAAIASPEAFCFLLPPDPKAETVAEAEDHAIAFCTQPNVPGATGAKVFPDNFIVSAHYKKNTTAGWVQATGLLNPEVYGMSMTDDGGQYDVKAPVGASCAGYNSFVNLIEPSSSRYCIRCCMDPLDCNVKISERGCRRIVPGYYGLGGSVQGTLMYPATAELSADDLRMYTEQPAQSSSGSVPHAVKAEDAAMSLPVKDKVVRRRMVKASALEDDVHVISFTPVTSDTSKSGGLELGRTTRRLVVLSVIVAWIV